MDLTPKLSGAFWALSWGFLRLFQEYLTSKDNLTLHSSKKKVVIMGSDLELQGRLFKVGALSEEVTRKFLK